MGHNPNSKSYMNSYKARTAIVDIQGIMRGIGDARDVRQLSGMSLGRVKNSPMTLSLAGEERVMNNVMVREASRDCDKALDALTDQYGS